MDSLALEIKCKRYYTWKDDTVLMNKQWLKGEIYTHYQGMNGSLTLFNRDPISDWLLFTTLYDRNNNELYENDVVLTNNNTYYTVGWYVKDNRKAGWKMKCAKGEWHNIDTNVIQIVGNTATEE